MTMKEIIDSIEDRLNEVKLLKSFVYDSAEYGDLDSMPSRSEFSDVLAELVSVYEQLDDAVLKGEVIPEDSIYLVASGRWKSHHGLEADLCEGGDIENMAYGRYSW